MWMGICNLGSLVVVRRVREGRVGLAFFSVNVQLVRWSLCFTSRLWESVVDVVW